MTNIVKVVRIRDGKPVDAALTTTPWVDTGLRIPPMSWAAMALAWQAHWKDIR